MREIYLKELLRLEEAAHEHAFTSLGTQLWELFLIKELYYNEKFGEEYGLYRRRW